MTHILYRAYGVFKQYFSGVYAGEYNEEGLIILDLKWSINKDDATQMSCTDAWNLCSMCRTTWPLLSIEVQRIKEYEEI